jgi:nitric oxide dioxygenase
LTHAYQPARIAAGNGQSVDFFPVFGVPAGRLDRPATALPATVVADPAAAESCRIDLEGLDVPADAQVYLCGPLPFMEQVRRELLARHVPEKNIHYEVFGPDTWLPAA